MNKQFLHNQNEDPGKGRTPSEEIQASIHPYNEEIHTADGSEFLDDAIRMKEQPWIGFEGKKDE